MSRIILALSVALTLSASASADAVETSSWAAVKKLHATRGEDGAVTIAFSPEAATKRPATTEVSAPSDAVVSVDSPELSATETRSISRVVYPRGKTQIYLSDLNGTDLDDDLYVSLGVPNGAVDEEVVVTMTVIGNRLSDLVIAFQPGGLVFNAPATLWVRLGPALVDVATTDLTVWHQYEDGTVEATTLEATKDYQNGSYEFQAVVPGFSRYGLR